MPKKLYVGNLDYEMTDEELKLLFSQCGQVAEAKIIKDNRSGKSKGFGFVQMLNDDEAMHAMSRMKGKEVKGREIIVNEAEEKAPSLKRNSKRPFREGKKNGLSNRPR